jgi:hypothetical protein
MNGKTWTQGAREVDRFAGGSATISLPVTCNSGGGFVDVYIGHLWVGRGRFDIEGEAGLPGQTSWTTDIYPTVTPSLFEPGKATSRTLFVKIWDSCAGTDEDVTFTSVKVDIAADR